MSKIHKPKSTFEQFNKMVIIIVFFSEKMDLEEINNCIQDWYVLYKEAGDYGIVEYMKQHLQDVNRNSHDFWLDERGLLLLEVQSTDNHPFITF